MNHPVRKRRTNQFSFPSFLEAFGEIANASHNATPTFSPFVNITENEDRFLISLALPGFTKKEVGIQIEKNKLVIKSEIEKSKDDDNTKFRKREFAKASFEKSFILPDNVDKENLKAQFKNGVLAIDITKVPEAKPLSIKVS